jgi:hypothetical protein
MQAKLVDGEVVLTMSPAHAANLHSEIQEIVSTAPPDKVEAAGAMYLALSAQRFEIERRIRDDAK